MSKQQVTQGYVVDKAGITPLQITKITKTYVWWLHDGREVKESLNQEQRHFFTEYGAAKIWYVQQIRAQLVAAERLVKKLQALLAQVEAA